MGPDSEKKEKNIRKKLKLEIIPAFKIDDSSEIKYNRRYNDFIP